MYGLKMAPYFYLSRAKTRKIYGPIDLIVPNAYITERQHYFFWNRYKLRVSIK